jgi:hypothetical protein
MECSLQQLRKVGVKLISAPWLPSLAITHRGLTAPCHPFHACLNAPRLGLPDRTRPDLDCRTMSHLIVSHLTMTALPLLTPPLPTTPCHDCLASPEPDTPRNTPPHHDCPARPFAASTHYTTPSLDCRNPPHLSPP